MFSRPKPILVATLEATTSKIALVRSADGVPEVTELESFDPAQFTADATGRRLFEEVARRCSALVQANRLKLSALAVSLPGSIKGTGTLSRSSRLGVFEQLDVAALFAKHGLRPSFLLRDVDCLAAGELAHNHEKKALPQPIPDFAYVFVDEGVGSTLYINGQSYRGAGFAGPIGRLIVEPDGAYNTQFRSQGPLEVFLGRPAISQGVVNLLLTELGKTGLQQPSQDTFRRAVLAASKGDPRSLPLSVINKGVLEGDPIAIRVIDRAAHYLGLAIATIIVIVNPPTIVLGGGVVTELQSFADATITYARRYSWEQAWNSTAIRVGVCGRDHQFSGAAFLTQRLMSEQSHS